MTTTPVGRKAKDGFGDRMLLRTARGALAGRRVFVVAFRDPCGARRRHLAAIDTLSPSLSLCGIGVATRHLNHFISFHFIEKGAIFGDLEDLQLFT